MADLHRQLGDFLAELKRRKVFQVAVVYAAVGFVIVQVADIVFPALHLPGWTLTFVVAVAILGFPIALVLAWAFEVTPEGVKRTPERSVEENDSTEAPVRATGSAAGSTLEANGRRAVDESDVRERAIAVLPFETLGEEKASAFTDAIHGDVLTRLSNISDLCVISRISVLRYRRPDKPLPVIADELGVGWILGGEVQEIADQVQVNARLVDAREDRQVWAESYRRNLTAQNVFQIQTEITRAITAALEARLTMEERRTVEEMPTQNLEAYRRYAHGRRWLDQRTEEGIRTALEYFQRAIEEDRGYALAWVGLADSLLLLYTYAYEVTDHLVPRAAEAIERALELDPELAEAYASRGHLHAARREGPAAVRELERAIELRPGYAEAHNWLSWVSQLLGDRQKALESARRAAALDPLSPEPVSNLVLSYLTNRDAESALREARRLRELQPDWTTGDLLEGLALYHLGRFTDAISVLQDLTVEWSGSGPHATLALAHVATGDVLRARELLTAFEEADDRFAAGLVHAALGEQERAIEAFRSVDHFDDWAILAVHHLYPDVLGRIRDDPRFEDVQREVNRSWRQ